MATPSHHIEQTVNPSGRSLNTVRRLSHALLHQMATFMEVESSEQRAIRWDNRRKRYATSVGALRPEYEDSASSSLAGQGPDHRKSSVAMMTLQGLGSVVTLARSQSVKQPTSEKGLRPDPNAHSQSISAGTVERSKRIVGVGVVGRFFKRKLHRGAFTRDVTAQLDDFDDYRPYFTYWVTFVHVVAFCVASLVYDLAPVGLGKHTERKTIRLSSLAHEIKEYTEFRNLWIGPREMDLIHLGARYSPCMRVDPNLKALLDLDRKMENGSACCVRNDGLGCVQRVEAQCDLLSTWEKWKPEEDSGPDGRTSGSVCGQDPSYCIAPASADPFEWPDSIVDWPLCTETRSTNKSQRVSRDRHMSCELLGHPCCFGIHGECWITTREHCDLIRGRFHMDKFLCSQTSCFEQICGMIPFSSTKKPDQVYRLWTSLFLHAGLLHLLVTVVFQMWVMRDLEKLTGALRLALVYIGSGIAGNLASCTFMPYTVEVGPSGSQFGVLACLMVEVLQSYQMYRYPRMVILKLFCIIFVLFLFGLLPWFDNWAHIFGFSFGFLLAFALMPYVTFGRFDRRRKIIIIVICLGSTITLFVVFIIVFYVVPLTECHFCRFLNCIPLTADFCENRDIHMKDRSAYCTSC